MPKNEGRAETIEPVVVEDKGEKLYHCGCVKTLPFFSVDVGGINFPRHTQIVSFDEQSRETIRTDRVGAYYHLAPADIERIKKAAARKVVRFVTPDKSKGFILNVQDGDGKPNPRYRKNPADEPLAKFIYLREATQAEADGGSPGSSMLG